jgi:REP element-mobilizing transposase RayT
MPRSVRIQYPGAIYHVMCRGDRKEDIFLDRWDREVFMETLVDTCKRTGFRIHSYVLMSNHYHLLMETPEANLVEGMRWFQGTYTARFNSRHRQGGHVFQGRYKAIPIEGEEPEYFRMVSDYIHLNPVRAGLVATEKPDVAAYEWSSVPAFVSAVVLPNWLNRARVFESLGLPDEGARSRRRYLEYLRLRAKEVMGSETDEELSHEWRLLRRGWYVGGDMFRIGLQEMATKIIQGRKRSSYQPEGLERHDEGEAEKLIQRALVVLGMNLYQIRRLKQNDVQKQAVAWLIKTRTIVSASWIRERLSMGDESNIRRAVAQYRKLPTRETKQLRQRLLHLCRD